MSQELSWLYYFLSFSFSSSVIASLCQSPCWFSAHNVHCSYPSCDLHCDRLALCPGCPLCPESLGICSKLLLTLNLSSLENWMDGWHYMTTCIQINLYFSRSFTFCQATNANPGDYHMRYQCSWSFLVLQASLIDPDAIALVGVLISCGW